MSVLLKFDNREYFSKDFRDEEVSRLIQAASSAVNKSEPGAAAGQQGSKSPPPPGEIRQVQVTTQNPFVQGPDGRLYIDLCMNMSFFKVEEIDITVQDNVMTVKATQLEKSKSGAQVKNELVRELQLPTGSDVTRLEAVLTRDGILIVSGPLR